MSPNDSAAFHLEGQLLEDGWQIVSRWDLSDDRTPAEFSVGYLARHTSGRLGYCKALDFADALNDEDPPAALGRMLDSYRFERDLLKRCRDRRLSRVVRALASGTARVPGASPDAVSYLILELADGDARDLLDLSDPADCLMRLKAAHHAAVGLNQLHSSGVAHQDVKPANVLTWRNDSVDGWESKIGDLGRAYDPHAPSPHDDLTLAGDPLYAPPELLYASSRGLARGWREAGDMFMFGNLLSFLVCSLSFTGVQSLYLDASLKWNKYSGTYEEVLPYLLDAYGLAAERIRSVLHKELADDVAGLLAELCHPDPNRRGDAINRRRGQNPYSLSRYITRIDLLTRRVAIRRARAGDGE